MTAWAGGARGKESAHFALLVGGLQAPLSEDGSPANWILWCPMLGEFIFTFTGSNYGVVTMSWWLEGETRGDALEVGI